MGAVCSLNGCARLLPNAGCDMEAATRSPLEREAFSAMQARLVALLLRYDEAGFRRRVSARRDYAAERDERLLKPYRVLGALFALRDELFDDIVPRIVRRLSFTAPHRLVVEEPPARGRVHWERTLDAVWDERPGEPPLRLYARQRWRDFATPENLLTVATLLEYRAAAQDLLWEEARVSRSAALRHPLHELVERCERELAFPQFAGIRARAQRIVEGDEGGVAELERRVREWLIPGSNSAYQDLLTWRARLASLRLLRRDELARDETLGADPARDNYLYQVWIFYELADLLAAPDIARLDSLDPTPGQMMLRFRWGEGNDVRRYELRHDQSVPCAPDGWEAEPRQRSAVPGVRPDFYLWRIDPPSERVEHNGALIWREPGMVWDAKYYRERESPNAPSLPVKRMVADLALLGEAWGALLFAFLVDGGEASGYRLRPVDWNQRTAPDQEIVVQPLRPALDPRHVRATLTALIDAAHARLRTPRTPRCSGVFLDALSLEERGALPGRDGAVLAADDLLICPKPHIGAWRIDLVSRAAHCCRDARFCHIISQPGATPPVRPPRTAVELLAEMERLFLTGDVADLSEEMVVQVSERIESLTRRFAQFTGALNNLGRYEAQLGDIGLDRTLHLLAPSERESLALAIYLRDQLDEVRAGDYSAPVIHIARVFERELQRRILAIPGIPPDAFPHGKPTLGSLGGVRRKHPLAWQVIEAHLRRIWNGVVDDADPNVVVTVDQFIEEIEHLSRARNQAAHTTPIPRERFRNILRTLCSAGPLRVGALNVLLIAWRVEG